MLEGEQRLVSASARLLERLRSELRGLVRGLQHPSRLVEQKTQDLDNRAESLRRVMALLLQERRGAVRDLAHRLPQPRETIADKRTALAHAVAGLRHQGLVERLSLSRDRLARARRDLDRCLAARMDDPRRRLGELSKLLESYSYKGVLERGFAVVRDASGTPLTRAAAVPAGAALAIEFADGETAAIAGGAPTGPSSASRPKPRPPGATGRQGDLF